MKYTVSCLLALSLVLCFAGAGSAHRVNVFAFVDGDAIQVECSFSRSQKVKNGKLVITDLETGAPLLEGITDDQGMFRFRPAEEILRAGHGLRILLLAEEGHQDAWQISPEELGTLSASAAQARRTDGSSLGQENAVPRRHSGQPPTAGSPGAVATIGAEELEAIVGRVVDAKLAPLKQAVARQQDPGLRDIIGGLGWIIGLLGLAAYMKYRR